MSSCGTGTKAKDDPFLFRNHFPLPVRVMVGLFGLVLWLLPYSLLIAPQWNHFSWLLVPFGLIGVAGAVGGGLFIVSSLIGEARETRLDLVCQQLVQTSRDWLLRRHEERVPFADISIIELRKPAWARDEEIYSIHAMRDDGTMLPAFGAFPSQQEAEKITTLMGHRPNGLSALDQNWTKAELAALKRSMEAQTARSSCGTCSPGGMPKDGPLLH